MNKVLVTGATGKLGSSVLEYLLDRTSPDNIVALSRDPYKSRDLIGKGIEVRYANYADRDSLRSAMKGIGKILLISGNDIAGRFIQHRNVIDAASENDVEYLAYTSISIKDMISCRIGALTKSHVETENYLKESGMNYSILRNTLYADDLPYYTGSEETFFSKGILFSAGSGKVPFALREEMAEAFANLLLQQAPDKSIYEIGGSEAFSFTEIAMEISRLANREIHCDTTNPTLYAALIQKMGLPEHVAIFLLQTSEDIRRGLYDITTEDLENLLGRKPAGLPEILGRAFEL